ncbi:DUF1877 family protein [Mucilaginibacter terrae]|uniref:DUF1877 family protein n=1 Tax=Mucilaginibacter terrae TaxID=1955052 RepID=A0ABU3GU80_9SPHI|nr:DUF1877 family protein [Mucilaginibacter terrae]MDT3403314.1 hypothetical protein [Mucilaginibacter terrae]
MSQSTSYYSIPSSEFLRLKDAENVSQPEYTDVATLHQSHEGLRYILVKTVPSKINSITELFNPESYIDSLPDFENENADIDALLNNIPLYYLTPEKVNIIHSVLTTVTNADICKNFSSNEFNKNGIYPEVWNDSLDPDSTFNLNHLTKDFKDLNELFSKASLQNNYVIVCIG